MKYFVKEGKSITSKSGILGPHIEVTKEKLGQEDKKLLDDLCKRKLAYKAEKSIPEVAAEKAEAEKKSAEKKDEPKKGDDPVSADDLALIIMELGENDTNSKGVPNLKTLRALPSMKDKSVNEEIRDAAMVIVKDAAGKEDNKKSNDPTSDENKENTAGEDGKEGETKQTPTAGAKKAE